MTKIANMLIIRFFVILYMFDFYNGDSQWRYRKTDNLKCTSKKYFFYFIKKYYLAKILTKNETYIINP